MFLLLKEYLIYIILVLGLFICMWAVLAFLVRRKSNSVKKIVYRVITLINIIISLIGGYWVSWLLLEQEQSRNVINTIFNLSYGVMSFGFLMVFLQGTLYEMKELIADGVVQDYHIKGNTGK